MKDLQNLVHKFMENEEVTLKQALLQASLGLSATAGDIAEITRGVIFNGYPYTEDRKKKNAEILGRMLFYWIMIASTTDVSPEEIQQQFITEYNLKKNIHNEELRASIVELLKHVKTEEKVNVPKLTEQTIETIKQR